MSRDPFYNIPPPPSYPLFPEQPPSHPPYQSGHLLSRWVIGFLVVNMVLGGLGILSTCGQVGLLSSIKSGKYISRSALLDSDNREQLIGTAQLIVYFFTVVLFLIWFHRAYRNLPALGARGLKHTPRGAVAWWFVPFASFVKPYQIMTEVWRASNPDGSSTDGMGWKRLSTPSNLKLWWGFWIASSLIGNVLLRFTLRVEDPSIEAYIGMSWLGIGVDCLDLLAAALIIEIVNQISRWQETTYMTDGDPEPPYYLTPARSSAQSPTPAYRFQVRRVARSPREA
jgi:hypothetical protein